MSIEDRIKLDDAERLVKLLPDILDAAVYADPCDCKSCKAIAEAHEILKRNDVASNDRREIGGW